MHFRILKMIATSGFLTALECTKFVFGRGSAPDPAGEAYSATQTPLNQQGGLGSAVSSPSGVRAEPRPKRNLVHSKAVRKPLVGIILSNLKCTFYSGTIKI